MLLPFHPATQELYGGTAAGQLLSAFSRLFTYYLSWHGFTCGFDDLLLVRDAGGSSGSENMRSFPLLASHVDRKLT